MFAVGFPKILRSKARIQKGKADTPLSPRGLIAMSPLRLSQPIQMPETIIQMLPSPGDSRYIAALSSTRLSLWSSGQHRTLLFQDDLKLPPKAGEPIGMVWAPHTRFSVGSVLMICTKNGGVFRFCVEKLPHGAAPKGCACQPIQAATDSRFFCQTPAMVTPDSEDTLFVDSQIFSVASLGLPEGFLLGTRDGRIHFISWHGDVIGTCFAPNPSGFDAMSSTEVTSIDFLPESGLLAISIACGFGCLCQVTLISEEEAKNCNLQNRLKIEKVADISCNNITSLSFNPKYSILAVGCKDGSIELHNIDENIKQSTVIERTLSLSQWGISGNITGQAIQLNWTLDGGMLAVGWQRSGLSVWSLHGCRLLCTTNSNANEEREFLKSGISSLCWVNHGFGLLIAEKAQDSWLTEIPFIKSPQGTTTPSSQRIIMLGSDSIWLLSHRVASSLEFAWSPLLVPEDYISNNWPIERIAIDQDGECIAVSGKKGFAICYSSTGMSFRYYYYFLKLTSRLF